MADHAILPGLEGCLYEGSWVGLRFVRAIERRGDLVAEYVWIHDGS